MTYYLFCYRSRLGIPDLAEAQEIVEQQCSTDGLAKSKLSQLARQLTTCNPALAQFTIQEPDLLPKRSVQEKETIYQHILLIEKEGKTSPQINIYYDNISLEIPAVSSILLAEQAIDKITIYLEIICAQTGYFVYDPQTGAVDDCSHTCISQLKTYLLSGALIKIN